MRMRTNSSTFSTDFVATHGEIRTAEFCVLKAEMVDHWRA